MKLTTACVVLLGSASLALANALTPGNVLVTDGHSAARHLFEYTPTGTLVQTFDIPAIQGQDVTETARDVVVDALGRVIVFNGTFEARLSVLDPVNNTWSYWSDPIVSVYGNVTFGKVASWGDYVFAPDHETSGNPATGIIRLNVLDGSWTRFAEQAANDEAVDLSIGANGLLYSLNGAGSPSGRFIQVFNPATLELLNTINLPTGFVWGQGNSSRDLFADSAGNLYLNQLYGPIYKLSPAGDVLGSYSYTQTSFCVDMDVAPDGAVLLTQMDGRVTLLDSSFQEVRTFDATGYHASGSFGAWVHSPVPEPSTGLSVLAAWVLLAKRRRRLHQR